MIIWQQDPNFNNEQHLTNPHDFDAYADYINALRTMTEGFDGQVAPRNTHWVSAHIEPRHPNVFVFEPRIVAGNVP